MNRARHWAALLLAPGLALALAGGLAACGGSADGDPSPAPAETAPQAAEPAEPAEPPAPDVSTPTARVTPAPQAETPEPPTPPAAVPITEPPAEPVAPVAPEVDPPPDEPASTATAASESTAAPGEPPMGDPSTATDEAEPLPLLYDTYDLSGAVAEPGHYVFLADPSDPASAVTTYEGLRDGTATALLIHTHDAHGISRAARYDAVATGDLVEWKQADDCFVRYTVTSAPAPAAGATVRAFGVAWMTYAFTGCSGTIATSTAATLDWGALPDLGGTSLSTPVVHGIYQLVPTGWTGATKERELQSPPVYSTPASTTDLAVARTLDLWREPALPEGWVFSRADSVTGDHEVGYGYCAWYLTEPQLYHGALHRFAAFQICGKHATARWFPEDASWRDGASAGETRVIAGRPALVTYSPPGPDHDPLTALRVWIYDPATESEYHIIGKTGSLSGGNVAAVIAIARSLFEAPNPP